MNIHKEFTMGQTAFMFKIPEDLINDINTKMDEEIKNNEVKDASTQLSAKIKKEYQIMHWLPEVDKDKIFFKCVKEVLNKAQMYASFTAKSVVVDNAWINDQVEHEYQVIHRHSGQSIIGFASILFLKVPDFGPEANRSDLPHNGRTMLIGNCQGQFCKKNVMIQPEVGDFYIFPYDLEHMVYPFVGDGLRRSLSINYDVFHQADGKQYRAINNDNFRQVKV